MIDEILTCIIMIPIIIIICCGLVKKCNTPVLTNTNTNVNTIDNPPSYVEIEVVSELPKYQP